MSHLWSCSIVWLALWLSSMELRLPRSGQELVLSSKTSSFIASAWFFFFFQNQIRHFCVILANYFPFSIALFHSLFPLHLGQPNFPSPKMILVSSSYPTSKSGSKRRQFKGQIVPNSIYVQFIILKNHLTYIWYLRANFTYLWKKLALKQCPGCVLHPFNICKTNTATEIKLFFS